MFRSYNNYYKKGEYNNYCGNYDESYYNDNVRSYGRELQAVSWKNHQLSNFKKDFYSPHPNVVNRSNTEVQQYRESKSITIKGNSDGNNNPIIYFEESNFPDYIARTIK